MMAKHQYIWCRSYILLENSNLPIFLENPTLRCCEVDCEYFLRHATIYHYSTLFATIRTIRDFSHYLPFAIRDYSLFEFARHPRSRAIGLNTRHVPSKFTDFFDLRSRKTVRISEQIMFADKCPCIFLRRMDSIVYHMHI